MEKPGTTELAGKAGISTSYASIILNDDPVKRRIPPRSLAIHIFRATGWRHDSIAALAEADMAVFERIEPWTPPAEQAAA